MESDASKAGNPWKGLNSYEEGEILYGRDYEVLRLTHYIFNNVQTVLYGRSGIGKTSILNAGIFPAARAEGMIPVTVRLKHDGEKSYLEQIEQALADAGIRTVEVVGVVDETKESLWEFFHRHRFISKYDGKLVAPLLVFDQFEELFTLQPKESIKREFFSELANLFNDVKPIYIVEKESEQFAATAVKSTKTIETGAFKGLSLSLNIGRRDNDGRSARYVENPQYHIVFALREDFLSSLERYSYNIPVMRNNRFALLPINEEQASEIIMRPRPGLVSTEVAKLIIEKVTDREDFELDGVPEIEVDSAILSVFLSRLYDEMVRRGEPIISAELVEDYSANIMDGFYSDAIKDIPEKCVHWLEDPRNLVNSEGHRDNKDRSEVERESGLSKEQLDDLIYNKKLLRQFPYGKSSRIELIHDVLCKVIVNRRQKRAEEQKMAAVHLKARKDKKKLLLRTIGIAGAVVGIVILGSLWLLKRNAMVKIVDQKQNLVLSLEEDATSVKDIDFWRAQLNVTGKYESGRDTLLYSRSIDKSEVSTPITINTDSCMLIVFDLDFGDFADIGKYKNQSLEIPMPDIMESPYVKLAVERDLPNLKHYKGRVLLDVATIDKPLENAIVMLGDIVGVTDSLGVFDLSTENLPDDKTSILIAKGGLGCFELQAIANNDAEQNVYRILPPDSLNTFFSNIASMDTVSHWAYSTVGPVYCANQGSQNGLYIKMMDGREDRLKMYWKKEGADRDRVMLSGYFFFNEEKKEFDKANAGKYAYYVGTGYIDRKTKKDENDASYRNFEFKGYDAAANVRTVTGKYYTVRGAGKYTGDIISNRRRIATFGHANP